MPRRRRDQNRLQPLIPVLALVLAALLAVAVFVTVRSGKPDPTGPSTLQSSAVSDPTQGSSVPATQTPSQPQPSESLPPVSQPPTNPPTQPPVVRESSATISATGDMLMHLPVINKYYIDGSYNFDGIFRYFREYVLRADYAVGNLETTLAGLDNGYAYHGYPNFNCPDYVIDGMKNAGFDLVLTANNHSYDTRHVGFERTRQIIADRNLDYLGTKNRAEDPDFIVREINGISIGMACYTYNTGTKEDGSVSLNTIPLSVEDSRLINTFDYNNLDGFYQEISENMTQMKAQGVEAAVLFIHWGDEYHIEYNATQKAMAQKLCDLGIDVIIGGHPHVVQPVELLTSTVDPNEKTVCIYSLGNAVSNQFRKNMNLKTGHTEDGVLFSVTFVKYSDGTVILENADLLPTCINSKYNIMPLDKSVADWKTKFGATDTELANMNASYDRTMAITGEGMQTVKSYLTQHVAEVESRLNVAK